MIKKIDINSLVFQNELENTKEFTKDVLKKYNFVFNPDDEVNLSVQMVYTDRLFQNKGNNYNGRKCTFKEEYKG